MKGYSQRLRDGLLEEEQVTESFRDTYKKEMRMMLETTISPLRKTGIIFLAICIGMQALYFGYKAFLTMPEEIFPGIIHAMVALFTGFLAGYLVFMVRKKRINNKTQPWLMVRVFFGFALVFMVVVLAGSGIVAHRNIEVAIYIAMCGFFVLLMATLGLVLFQVKRSEMRMYEKQLRMELRIAELIENVQK